MYKIYFQTLTVISIIIIVDATAGSTPNPYTGFVVGGYSVGIENHPYVVQLVSYRSQFCGGSILSTNYVLTAAHCVSDMDEPSVSIRYGTSERNVYGFSTNVSEILVHPLYQTDLPDYDIAVLRVEPPIELNGTTVLHVALSSEEAEEGSVADVTGWGLDSPSRTSMLKNAQVRILSRKQCTEAYSEIFTTRMICAAFPFHDACKGDSGGPLVSEFLQVGIVSFGFGCARQESPGVYTNIAEVRDFIDWATFNETTWV